MGISMSVMQRLKTANYDIIPIMSDSVYNTSTRFGDCEYFRNKAKSISGCEIIHSIKDAEPFGPKMPLDALIICPCTGNTLAKIANGITDTPVCMSVKAHLRSDRPLLIALASNDAISANLKNISALLMRKNIYFVPMFQDDPVNKPHSLVADFSLVEKALDAAFQGKQLRKLFL
jgi:dipicolinate synthase subunit B